MAVDNYWLSQIQVANFKRSSIIYPQPITGLQHCIHYDTCQQAKWPQLIFQFKLTSNEPNFLLPTKKLTQIYIMCRTYQMKYKKNQVHHRQPSAEVLQAPVWHVPRSPSEPTQPLHVSHSPGSYHSPISTATEQQPDETLHSSATSSIATAEKLWQNQHHKITRQNHVEISIKMLKKIW